MRYGALGSDKIIFDGLFNDYSLSSINGNLVIEDNRSDSLNGTTTLFNVEIAEFSDLNRIIERTKFRVNTEMI